MWGPRAREKGFSVQCPGRTGKSRVRAEAGKPSDGRGLAVQYSGPCTFGSFIIILHVRRYHFSGETLKTEGRQRGCTMDWSHMREAEWQKADQRWTPGGGDCIVQEKRWKCGGERVGPAKQSVRELATCAIVRCDR